MRPALALKVGRKACSRTAPEPAFPPGLSAEPGSRRPVVIVAGPTASGKSALALDLARILGGTVINADSMQVYRELRVLTARPSPEEEAEVPHRLYGVLPTGRGPTGPGPSRHIATHEADPAMTEQLARRPQDARRGRALIGSLRCEAAAGRPAP